MELELFFFVKMIKWALSTGLRLFYYYYLNDQVDLKYRTWVFLFNMTRWILIFEFGLEFS